MTSQHRKQQTRLPSSSSPLCNHSLHVSLCNTGASLTFHHSELFQDGSETHLHAACPVWKGQGSVPRQTRGSTEITPTEKICICRLHAE